MISARTLHVSAPDLIKGFDLDKMLRAYEQVVMPFLDSVQFEHLEQMDKPDRDLMFVPGAIHHERLSEFLSGLNEDVSNALGLLVSKAPFAPIVEPVIERMQELLPAEKVSRNCVSALSSILSGWEVGMLPTNNDSMLLADLLYSKAGRLPKDSAISMARIAGQHHRRGPAAGMGPSLDWLVDRFAVNPSQADAARNVWHEAMALAMVLTTEGTTHSDFVIFDEMPMEFIVKMCTRHSPSDPLTKDPGAPVWKMMHPSRVPDDGDMVAALNAHCRSNMGIRKALALQQVRSMENKTEPAISAGSSSPRL